MSEFNFAPTRIKVLIVDDKADMIQAYVNLLYFEKDIQVAGTAADGQEALLQNELLKPDVILMDIEMPVMDGVVAIQRLKIQGATSPVIAMSSEFYNRERALGAGAVNFLLKPFTGDEVAGAIRQAVAIRG